VISGQKRLDGAEDAAGEVEEGGDEVEDSVDGDAQETKGEQDEPDEGVEDHGKKRERPAGDQEDAEEEEADHWWRSFRTLGILTRTVGCGLVRGMSKEYTDEG
jgi:hypothetical protein